MSSLPVGAVKHGLNSAASEPHFLVRFFSKLVTGTTNGEFIVRMTETSIDPGPS